MMKPIYHTAHPLNYLLLKENAQRMRRLPTEAESILWSLIKNKQLNIKFRRQHIIGDFIVDFVDLDSQTIIEINGGYHNQENQINKDALRSDFLIGLGFSILRFKNEEIIANSSFDIDKIINHISQKIGYEK